MELFVPPLRKPTVSVVHDLEIVRHPHLFPPQMNGWGKHVLRAIERASAVIVPSEFVRTEIEDLVPSALPRTVIVPWPVSPLFSHVAAPQDKQMLAESALDRPFILYVGTIEPRKNVKMLLDAIRILSDESSDFPQLVLAGRFGWSCDTESAEIHRQSQQGKVLHLGYVDDNLLSVLYRSALATVYPSSVEGFGLPLIESMASGTPVVSGKGGSLCEVGGNAAQYIDGRSPEALADILRSVVSDSSLRESMIRRGFDHVGHFTHRNTASHVVQLYDRLL
jgi:alpha-1,3-rhamnosyl/mannosyltransferase